MYGSTYGYYSSISPSMVSHLEEKVKNLYKDMCDFDTDYEAFKSFLDHDSSLHKSKYIKKYLNSTFAKKRGYGRRKKRV